MRAQGGERKREERGHKRRRGDLRKRIWGKKIRKEKKV